MPAIVSFILNWIIAALVLTLVAYLLPGIHIDSFTTAAIATFALSIVNFLVRPVLGFLTAPINFVTLGLFSFILNAGMFGLAAWLVPGFEVQGFWWALLGSLLLSVLTSVVNHFSPLKSETSGPSATS